MKRVVYAIIVSNIGQHRVINVSIDNVSRRRGGWRGVYNDHQLQASWAAKTPSP